MQEMNKTNMFLMALMILKKAEVKLWSFVIKEKQQKTPNKYKQGR